MAETFKNASLVSVSNSSDATLYTAPASATTIILGVAIANKTTTDSTCKILFTDTSASTTTELIPTVTIPANTTLEVLAGQKYILETGDILKARAGAATTIDVTIGVLELT
tara:strand:- start:1409 stop:1741 length:333 start_codon:yes stop_codon:yes gene_type:complete